MKKLIVAGLMLAGLALSATSAFAFGGKKSSRCPTSCCAPAPTTCCSAPAPTCCDTTSYVDKVITSYKPVYTTQTVSYTVNKMVAREVVENVTTVVCVPEYRDEVRTCTKMVKTPRCVTKDVCVTRWVKETVVGPCGHCRTVCKPCKVMEQRTCTVWDCVPVTESYTVKVCCMKQVPTTVACKKIVHDCVPTVETRTVTVCNMVASCTTIKVPFHCGCPAPVVVKPCLTCNTGCSTCAH